MSFNFLLLYSKFKTKKYLYENGNWLIALVWFGNTYSRFLDLLKYTLRFQNFPVICSRKKLSFKIFRRKIEVILILILTYFPTFEFIKCHARLKNKSENRSYICAYIHIPVHFYLANAYYCR